MAHNRIQFLFNDHRQGLGQFLFGDINALTGSFCHPGIGQAMEKVDILALAASAALAVKGLSAMAAEDFSLKDIRVF